MKVLSWETGNFDPISKVIASGGLVILPTDTLYGLVSSALNKNSFLKIYEVKHRNPGKKLIVLISSTKDLAQFGVTLNSKQKDILSKLWPGPFSVELPCVSDKYSFLRCGTDTLSFRCPGDRLLRQLLKLTGPLVAPSANPEAEPPAITIDEAKKYFTDKIDLYVDGGLRNAPSSTILSLVGSKPELIRGEMPSFLHGVAK